ncbi:MAG: DUF4249 domain-containing protein [Tannerella sp.]|jgi:hypothetical protein|nr:DUF4249 domain-containing protein [Tannerella sp.]
MTRTAKSLLTLLVLLLHAGACTAPIDIETNSSKPVIVIYGCLTENMAFQKIRISGSSPYFSDTQNAVVTNASVSIRSSDSQTFELEENPDERGTYLTLQPMAAMPGVTYTLSVEVDFDGDGIAETYTATATMTPPVAIDSIAINPLKIMGYRHYALNLFARDSPAPDYYLARFVINDTIETYRITDYTVFSDEGVNGQYLDNVTLWYFDDLDSELPFAGNIEIDTTFFVRPGYRISLLMSRVEQGYFNFINQCQQEKNGENPFFGGPPSNIETNISNGAAGYFAAFSTTAMEATVPKPEDE